MEKEEIVSLGEKSLEKEASLLKEIILSTDNSSKVELLLGEYKKQWEETNQITREYFELDDIENDSLGKYFDILIEYLLNYQSLINQKNKYEKLNDLEDYLSYIKSNIKFIYDYNQYLDFFNLLIWYIKQEEKTDVIYKVVDILLKDKRSLIALRNLVAERNIDLGIEPDSLKNTANSQFLVALMKLGLTHHFSISTINMIIDIYNKRDINQTIDGYILYLTLDLATHLMIADKYGLSLDDDDILESSIQNTKNTILKMPQITVSSEMIERFDNIMPNAKELLLLLTLGVTPS